MENIKAVFFDNDGTLTTTNLVAYKRYYDLVEKLSQKPFVMNNTKKFFIEDKLKSMGFNTDTYENEVRFNKAFYKFVLMSECGRLDNEIESASEEIFQLMWQKDKALFPDAKQTLHALKQNGIKIGIISDASSSLATSLSALNLSCELDTCTSSAEIRVTKPNPEIYFYAISKLGLSPHECIYVDDKLEDVLSASHLGFTAFRINRTGENMLECDITSLSSLLEYLNIEVCEDHLENE